jgi:hypothetical protein
MADDGLYEQGQKLWFHDDDGTTRPAVYVGDGDNAAFFGGPPLAYVVFADTRDGAEVELDRLTPRD